MPEQILPLADGRAHYLRDVMRLSQGDSVAIFNGERGEWLATIAKAQKRTVELKIEKLVRPPVTPRDLWLLFAPIKRTPLEWLLEKATELGATRLVPVLTDHTQVRSLNIERLESIVIEASEQCERLDVPQLVAPLPLAQILTSWNASRHLLVGLERAEGEPLKSLRHFAEHMADLPCALFIGPEGGFSDKEKQLFTRQSFIKPYTLGTQILRAETAALASLAIWQQG